MKRKIAVRFFYAWLKPIGLSITIKLSSFCSSLEHLPLTLLNSTQPPAAMILLVSSFKRQKDNLSVKVLLYWGAWCYHNLYCHWHCYILFQGWLYKPAKRREFCDVIGYQEGNIADPKNCLHLVYILHNFWEAILTCCLVNNAQCDFKNPT